MAQVQAASYYPAKKLADYYEQREMAQLWVAYQLQEIVRPREQPEEVDSRSQCQPSSSMQVKI